MAVMTSAPAVLNQTVHVVDIGRVWTLGLSNLRAPLFLGYAGSRNHLRKRHAAAQAMRL